MEHGFHGDPQVGQITLNDFPNTVQTQTQIIMNQHIPKSGNSRPGNFRMFLSQINREPLSGFRQFLEFAERGFASLPISQKYIAPLGIVILDGFKAL